MVNRLWPLKWVGFSNNQEYKNVRNAAKVYANVLNKYPLPARTPAVITEINKAKSNLQLKINKYLENIPVAPGAAPAARPGLFRRPAPPSAPAVPAPGPNGSILGNLYNKPNSKNAYLKQVPIFQGNGKYFYKPNPNGRNYATVLRRGNTTNFAAYGNGAGNLYVKNNATGRFNKVVATEPPTSLNRLAFGKFMMLAPTLGRTTPQNQAKNYLNGNNRYKNNFGQINFNAVRRITRNTNVNAATRGPFWAAVNAEKARSGPPIPKNLAKFKTWYTSVQGLPNANRADPYVTIIKGNNRARKIEIGGGIMRGNNNNNSRKVAGGFWNAVNAEMARRATA